MWFLSFLCTITGWEESAEEGGRKEACQARKAAAVGKVAFIVVTCDSGVVDSAAMIYVEDKIVEELSKLTVLEAAELSKKLEEHWGVTAAAPVAVAAAAFGRGEASNR